MEISLNQGNRLASLLIEMRLDFSSKNLSPGRRRCGEREGGGRRKDGGGEGWGSGEDGLKMRMVGEETSVLLKCAEVSSFAAHVSCATSRRKRKIFFFLW